MLPEIFLTLCFKTTQQDLEERYFIIRLKEIVRNSLIFYLKYILDSDLNLVHCKFRNNYAKYGGGALYFLFLVPNNIFKNLSSIFYFNRAREELNDWNSSPFRLILLNSSSKEFNINASPYIINPLKLKPGVRFSFNLNIWLIDQFNKTLPITTYRFNYFIYFI